MATSVIIDIAVVSLIIVFAVLGIIKGFAKTFIATFGTLISLLLAILLAKSVAGFLEENFMLATKLSEKLTGFLEKIFGADAIGGTFGDANEQTLSSGGFAGWLIRAVLSLKTEGTIVDGYPLNEVLSKIFAYYITVIIAVLILYILFKIVFFIVGDLIVKARQFEPVNAIDRLLGLLLGVVRGIVVVNLLIMIISVIPLSFCQTIAVETLNAPFTNIINNIDVFGLLLRRLFDPASGVHIIA